MRIPPSILSIITDLDSSNSSLSSLSHSKGVPGLSDWQKVSICSVAAKAYDTWFMSPNQEGASVMFVGVWKSCIASRYFLHGWTLMEVISKLANSTVSNLSGLRMMPLCNDATDVKPLDCLEEALGEIVGLEKGVINAFSLVRNMRNNLIESSGVAIT